MIGEDRALAIANEAVSQYKILFKEVEQKPTAEALYVLEQLGVVTEQGRIPGEFVWSAEADLGKKRVGTKMFETEFRLYIDIQGNILCKCCKLKDVIPGVVPVENIFGIE